MRKTDAENRALPAPFWARIDALDDRPVDLPAERFGAFRQGVACKAANDIPAVLEARLTASRSS